MKSKSTSLAGDAILERNYTNFDGDLDGLCPFCGEMQREHLEEVGQLDGIQYMHRMPCAPERRKIGKRMMKEAAVVRFVVSVYEVGKYLWSKIPFKEEFLLIFRLIRRAYMSVRGVIYYLFRYRHKP